MEVRNLCVGEKQLLRELKDSKVLILAWKLRCSIIPYHHLGIIEDSKVLILAWSEMHPSLFKNMQLTNWLLPPEVLL